MTFFSYIPFSDFMREKERERNPQLNQITERFFMISLYIPQDDGWMNNFIQLKNSKENNVIDERNGWWYYSVTNHDNMCDLIW